MALIRAANNIIYKVYSKRKPTYHADFFVFVFAFCVTKANILIIIFDDEWMKIKAKTMLKLFVRYSIKTPGKTKIKQSIFVHVVDVVWVCAVVVVVFVVQYDVYVFLLYEKCNQQDILMVKQ